MAGIAAVVSYVRNRRQIGVPNRRNRYTKIELLRNVRGFSIRRESLSLLSESLRPLSTNRPPRTKTGLFASRLLWDDVSARTSVKYGPRQRECALEICHFFEYKKKKEKEENTKKKKKSIRCVPRKIGGGGGGRLARAPLQPRFRLAVRLRISDSERTLDAHDNARVHV